MYAAAHQNLELKPFNVTLVSEEANAETLLAYSIISTILTVCIIYVFFYVLANNCCINASCCIHVEPIETIHTVFNQVCHFFCHLFQESAIDFNTQNVKYIHQNNTF